MNKIFVILLLPIALAISLVGFAPAPEVKILFVGDMLFDRHIRKMIDEKGSDHVFSCIDELLKSADVVVGNLEGPITPYPSMSLGSVIGSPENFTFTFPPQTAALLKAHNIGIVSIGNNHIMNFGRDGLERTKEYLAQAGVQYFGDPALPEEERVLRAEMSGVHLSFINWSDWTSATDDVVAQVRTEVEAGRVAIVYAHWGEEYVPASERMKQLAHSFIDAGATAVIGSHPHIVQEHEVYQGKDIYYSLGNFIFDQYWNKEVSRGLAVMLTIGKDGATAVEHPVEMLRDGRTCLLVE